MKILLTSYFFHPSVGGIETVSRRLAQDFAAAGHDVRVVTLTPNAGPEDPGYQVIRCPGPLELFGLARWCDVYFQNNISLGLAWPLLFVRRPWVVAHHTYIARVDATLGWRDRLKLFLIRRAHNIAISEPIAQSVGTASVTIGNPYDDQLFRPLGNVERTNSIIFVGRLVSDKGVDLLLQAVAALRERGIKPRVTVVGEGPESPALRRIVSDLGLESQVQFLGYKLGPDLVELLNQHSVVVVPSRWPEPFGLVALEGIACGCVVVGSAGGGLKDAIGRCGLTFPNGSLEGLTDALARVLSDPALVSELRSHAESHLRGYRRQTAAARYLEVMADAVSGRKR